MRSSIAGAIRIVRGAGTPARARRLLRLRRSARDRTASAPAASSPCAGSSRSTGGLRSRICFDTSMTRSNSFSANSSSSALVSTRADSACSGKLVANISALSMPCRCHSAFDSPLQRRLVLLIGDQRRVTGRGRLRVQRIVVSGALVFARGFGEAAGFEQHFAEQVARRRRFRRPAGTNRASRDTSAPRLCSPRASCSSAPARSSTRPDPSGSTSAARRLRAHPQPCAAARTPSRTHSARRTPACLRAPARRSRPSDTPRSCASAATARNDRPGGASRTPRTPAPRPGNAPSRCTDCPALRTAGAHRADRRAASAAASSDLGTVEIRERDRDGAQRVVGQLALRTRRANRARAACRRSTSTRSSTCRNEATLSSPRLCLNSDQPCLYRPCS